jgi:peptidoglycan/xylan/chitin deacetylase (PgdA/CDA1 family)
METVGTARIRRALKRVRMRLWPPALVLMYHRVAAVDRDPWRLAVTPRHFAEHLDVVRGRGRPLTCAGLTRELRTGRAPRAAIALTLDDGYADNLSQARPLLERHDVPATIFVAAAYLDRPEGFWWDQLERLVLTPEDLPPRLRLEVRGRIHEYDLGADRRYPLTAQEEHAGWHTEADCPTERHRLFLALYRLMRPLGDAERRHTLDTLREWTGGPSPPRPVDRPLSAPELRAIARDGLVEIGAHTLTHPQLSTLGGNPQREEIWGSRSALQDTLGREVTSFAYPYGSRSDYTPETVTLVREAGFSGACTTVPGAVRSATDPFELPRLHVEDCDGDGLARRLAEWTAGGA